MPLIRTIQINPHSRLGVWKITEDEAFFMEKVNISTAIHHPHKRLQHFAGRYLLVELFPEFPIVDILIMDSRKPYLACGTFHFSISHCGDYVAAIVSTEAAVGIDIEEVKLKIEKVSHKFLSPEERAFIDPVHSLPHKTICWSAKEAVFKWYGLGSVDFKENMTIEPFTFQSTGMLTCNFNKADKNARLYLQYLLENDLCLTWTA
ncbi:4'-phosphopantetheinyl transferase superfamily protein [Chitinophaga sp. CF118]|uniref:4'-phosphopantetheinyl transferase family protein n=1 Tax=Chitinophaga sp. CF118 TaxID=1884367 RepID=UPI0008F0A6C8|nr:4'-phosphopantetheinyl transferase superfamily protein [Chitinophaga sp. CF118]SFE85987.1 4'-phosphopantetheinyl transferase superfamily protein [Chitinophaga sp. CF118]